MQPCAISVIKGDITTLDVDAIINSANRSLLGGGGVDRAIHRAAGRELLAECIELCGCPVGESRLTKGYALPARHVIHTVGPVWLGGASDEVETLRRAVTSALDIARDMKFETVAFCCISRGIHRFPVDLAAKTTLEAMLAHDFAGRVTVCAYTDEDLETPCGFSLIELLSKTPSSLGRIPRFLTHRR